MKKSQPKILSIMEKEGSRKLNKLDYLVLSILVVVYSLFAFLNLGTTNFPTKVYYGDTGSVITLDFGKEVEIAKAWINPNISESTLALTADDGSSVEYEVIFDNMFRWHSADVALKTRTLQISTVSTKGNYGTRINEIAFFDAVGNRLQVSEVGGNSGVVDEQDTVPQAPSYFNGMYFDELYHARTAYENINNMYNYEWTHPPLGKLLIAVGIEIFGMTPFGWRFMGALFGVGMLPLLYLFAKRIFKRTDFALIVAALFAFDCMHFTQTRIATIDTFGVFFILLMYFFMYEHITMEHDNKPYWKTLIPLVLCGLAFGFGIAAKWIGFYAAAGLAVLLFSSWGLRLADIIKNRGEDRLHFERVNWFAFVPVIVGAVLILRSMTDEYNDLWYQGLLNSTTLIVFASAVVVAIGSAIFYHIWNRDANAVTKKLNAHFMVLPWCCLFFVLIPAVIYFVSFFPYFRYDALSNPTYGFKDAVDTMWKKQIDMYTYHSNLKSTHSSSSLWYQWPFCSRSTWFYFTRNSQTISNISTTGNIFVWGAGFIGFMALMIETAIGNVKAAGRSLKVGCAMVVVTYIVFLIAYNRSPDGTVPIALFIIMMLITVVALMMSKQATIKTLCIAFLANYLPWALVPRCMFIYHFFATVPFILLAGAFFVYNLERNNPKLKWIKWAWLALGILYFLLMFPAISGIPISRGYAGFLEYALPGGNIFHGTI